MTWRLSDRPHQTFNHNTLDAVIVQLRFEPVLRILDQFAAFQERVRRRFPGFEDRRTKVIELNPMTGFQTREQRELRFSAERDRATVILGTEAIAIECGRHRDRAVLLNDLRMVLDAINADFAPIVPTRLGLRYINIIDREAFARDLGRDVDWGDLITAPFLQIPHGMADLEDTQFGAEINSNINGGAMTVRYGLLRTPDRQLPTYRLDVDRYQERAVPADGVVGLIERFSDDIFQVFMTAAGPALIQWMERPIAP